MDDALRLAIDASIRALERIDSNVLLVLLVVVGFAMVASSVDDYLAARRRTGDAMRHFGTAFVREFERPLLIPDEPARPLQTRLRPHVHRQQLEILLAPAAGRRYPNLSDHRKNLEYDVGRVLQRLRAPSTAAGAPYAKGQWVVIPIQFRDQAQKAGGQ